MLAGAEPGTSVVFEATVGWSWLAELFEMLALEPRLADPAGCKAIASARLKNDKVDARTFAQLLRADVLPEAWLEGGARPPRPPPPPRRACWHSHRR